MSAIEDMETENSLIHPSILNGSTYQACPHVEPPSQIPGDILNFRIQRFFIKLKCQNIPNDRFIQNIKSLLNFYNTETLKKLKEKNPNMKSEDLMVMFKGKSEFRLKGVLIAHYKEKCEHTSTVSFIHIQGNIAIKDKSVLTQIFGDKFTIEGAKNLSVKEVYLLMCKGDIEGSPYHYGFPESTKLLKRIQ